MVRREPMAPTVSHKIKPVPKKDSRVVKKKAKRTPQRKQESKAEEEAKWVQTPTGRNNNTLIDCYSYASPLLEGVIKQNGFGSSTHDWSYNQGVRMSSYEVEGNSFAPVTAAADLESREYCTALCLFSFSKTCIC
jgi:hypothetical protein